MGKGSQRGEQWGHYREPSSSPRQGKAIPVRSLQSLSQQNSNAKARLPAILCKWLCACAAASNLSIAPHHHHHPYPCPNSSPSSSSFPFPFPFPTFPLQNLGQHSEETLWQLKCSRSAQNLRLSRARQMSSQPAAGRGVHCSKSGQSYKGFAVID